MEFKVEYTLDDELKTKYLSKDIITIGKLAENDIEIPDNTVSRHHCQLVKAGNSYSIVDQKSTNGTYVNGQRVQEKLLEIGDKVTIGRITLTFLPKAKGEMYRDSSDQQISLVVPLTDMIKAEKDQHFQTDELNFLTSLTKLGKSLIASQDMDVCFEKLSEMILEYLKPEKILIFSYDEKQNDIFLRYHFHKHKKKEEVANISKTIALKAIQEKVAVLSSNTRQDARFDASKSVIMYGITSAISVPIWTKDSIYGLIYVDSTSCTREFGQKDLQMMSILANLAGFSIEGMNILEKLNRERKLRARLEMYHSPAVVNRLLEKQDESLSKSIAYRESEASVLFLDIVKFTSRVERMAPIEVGMFLNHFFSEMTEIIFKHNGTLDKFIGDALMAVFGIPFEYRNHAEMSIRAALEMQHKIKEMNASMSNKDHIHVRMGINCGKLISGDFGSPKRLEFTVLGNTVNIASRLESSIAGSGEIVVSDSIYMATRDKFEFVSLGEKKLQGISQPVQLYKVTGTK